MIPWEKIREVEARAYAEYRRSYEETLANFVKSVESSIKRWSTAYDRIVENTWKCMEKQPTSLKVFIHIIVKILFL